MPRRGSEAEDEQFEVSQVRLAAVGGLPQPEGGGKQRDQVQAAGAEKLGRCEGHGAGKDQASHCPGQGRGGEGKERKPPHPLSNRHNLREIPQDAKLHPQPAQRRNQPHRKPDQGLRLKLAAGC